MACFIACHVEAQKVTAKSSKVDISVLEKPSEMRDIIERYTVDDQNISRSLPFRLSPTRDMRMKQLYTDWLTLLPSLPFDSMSQDGKIDYLLFQNYLSRNLNRLEIQAKRRAEEAPLIPFAQTISDFIDAQRRMESIDPEKVAIASNKLVKEVDSLRKSVETGSKPGPKTPAIKADRMLANRCADKIDGLRNGFNEWHKFYQGYDPIYTWWMTEPHKALDHSLQLYSASIREKLVGIRPDDKTTIIGSPIGKDALLAELQYEMIPYSPEQLVDIANSEFAWCDAEMKRASRDSGYGDDWHKALESVKNQHVGPGKQPELIRKLAIEAIDFLEKNDLVTVPELCKETWRMEMMSPERQLVNPFFLGGESIIVSYPTDTMTHESKMMSMRGNNIHFARATVFHELIPGHHLQGFMEERYKPYRGIFNTPFWVEGNALYWEMMFWNKGFPQTPENRIGMLFWRMHRCARIIFSLSFHLGKMTPEQCIDFLVERVGHERDNATAEVRRSFNGSYPPLYQAAYMLGGLQLRGLHDELVNSGKMTDKQYNDAILHENAIPIELLRASLTKQTLTRDFKTSWKFYKAQNQ